MMNELKKARKQTGLSQETLGFILGTNQAVVSQWEREVREIPEGTIERVAAIQAVRARDTSVAYQLKRIADALEEIAGCM